MTGRRMILPAIYTPMIITTGPHVRPLICANDGSEIRIRGKKINRWFAPVLDVYDG